MADFHELDIAAVSREGRDGVCLTFAVPPALADRFAFRPGQYLTLRADVGGEDLRRPYSICSMPGMGFVQVGVKRIADGRFSTYANRLQAGSRILAMPPDGRFIATTGGPANYLLVAAGSGITPMLSIAEATLAGHPEAEVTLVYGNRDLASVMFVERLSDLKDRYLGRFRLVHVLSREEQDVALLNGRIDGAKLDALAAAGLIDPHGADGIFVCGPGAMSDTVETHFLAAGIAPEKLHFERFLPADGQTPREISDAAREAAAEGVAVEVILDSTRRSFVLADAGQSVLEAAHAVGIELPFSCQNGMCCTCRCRMVEGRAEMTVNYSLQPWEMEAGFTLACQARPTTDRLVLDFDAA